jgi:hypothetical protein
MTGTVFEPTARFPTSGICGGTFTRPSLVDDGIALGTITYGIDNSSWVKVRSVNAIAAAATCTVNASTFAAAAGAGSYTAESAFPGANYFGWVRKTAVEV